MKGVEAASLFESHARIAVRALAEGYAYALDHRDVELLESLFVPEGELVVHHPDRPGAQPETFRGRPPNRCWPPWSAAVT